MAQRGLYGCSDCADLHKGCKGSIYCRRRHGGRVHDRGECKGRAIVTDGIISGAISLENGWWQDKDGFVSSSVLTNDTIEVLGTATTINSTLVNVRKA